jgi:predicted SAM-dependent methyltransferase
MIYRLLKPILYLLAILKAGLITVRRNKRILLELGADEKRKGWTTLGLNIGCDLFWDVNNRLPFRSNSVDQIYSSHLLEHLSYLDGQCLIGECHRVLKPGGTFFVCVPNAKLYIRAYCQNQELNKEKFLSCEESRNDNTKISLINYVAYMGGQHKTMFDVEGLIYRLKAGGFEDVVERETDLNLDTNNRQEQSIYARAVKK